MKVLVHNGLGIWLYARLLNRGKFHWGETWRGKQLQLTDEELPRAFTGAAAGKKACCALNSVSRLK